MAEFWKLISSIESAVTDRCCFIVKSGSKLLLNVTVLKSYWNHFIVQLTTTFYHDFQVSQGNSLNILLGKVDTNSQLQFTL